MLGCGLVVALYGLVVARLQVQPFIVTLASMIGVRGLAKWFTANENVDIGFGKDVAAQFADIFRDKAVVIGSYVAAALVFWILLSKTPSDAVSTGEALKFFAWSYAKGSDMAKDLDYVPMPAKTVGDIQKMWSADIKDASGKSLYAMTH